MRPSDPELEAMAQLAHTPAWRIIEPVLRAEQAKAMDVLMRSETIPQIHRAQGAVQVLLEFITLVNTAGGIVQQKRGG